jgi:hypothetical protein
MKRQKHEQPPTEQARRLDGIRSHVHDEDDDRPSGQDLKPQGSQLFKMDLPRFLKLKRER